MRYRLILTATLLCLLTLATRAGAAAAPPDISQFVNENTVLAIQADLTKIDGTALQAALLDYGKTAGIIGAEESQVKEAEAKTGLGLATKWIDDAKQAGATFAFVVMDSNMMQRSGPALIVPVSDDKAAAVAKLMPMQDNAPPKAAAGAPGGASQPARRPNPNMPQAITVPGVGVVWGSQGSVNAIKAIKPAPRADLTAAFKAAGTAPIKLAFTLDAKTRQMMAQNTPPMILGKPTTLITKDFQWASVAATAPPNVTIKGVAQSTDATSAKSTDELIVSAILMNQQNKNSKLPDELITLITPHAEGSQLVLNLDNKQVGQLAAALKVPMQKQREVAMRVQSASNIRQLLQICLLYSNDNKGKYPDDFKALQAAFAKYMGGANPQNAKRVLSNPRHPEIQPGYVYIKPAKGNAAGPETVVIYESHKDFGDGVNVGFADGHVEYVGQKQQFEQMLAKTAQQEQ